MMQNDRTTLNIVVALALGIALTLGLLHALTAGLSPVSAAAIARGADTAPDLQISKIDGVDVAGPGDTLTYTIAITNRGVETATGVMVTDTLPMATTFVGPAGTWQQVGSKNVYTHGVGDLAGDAVYTTTLVLAVGTTLPADLEGITNTIEVVDGAGAYAQDTDVNAVEVVPPEPTSGEVITVCLAGGCDFDTVQAAVEAADEGDEIRVAAGTYTGVSARAGMTQVVYISKTVMVRGGYTTTNWIMPDLDTNPTIVDARGEGRVFAIVPPPGMGGGISPTIAGLRITGGDASGLGGGPGWVADLAGDGKADGGGGVYVVSATATISGNQIVSNTADCGGGVYVERSASTVRDNGIWDNTASYGGGMGFLESAAAVEGNSVSENAAEWGAGIYSYGDEGTWEGNIVVDNSASIGGGGMCLHAGDGTLTDNAFWGNETLYGGGLYVYQSTAVMARNAITGNRANALGGGLYMRLSESSLSGGAIAGNEANKGGGLYLHEGEPLVGGALIRKNGAEWGGAVFIREARARLSGNEISGNVVSLGGGGVALVNCEAELDGNWITGNTAEQGGGLYVLDSAVEATNTVLAGNGAEGWGSGVYMTQDDDPCTAAMQHTTLVGNGWHGAVGLDAAAVSEFADGTGIEVRDGCSAALTNTILARHQVGIYAASGAEVTLHATLLGAGAWANDEDWMVYGTVVHVGDVRGDPGFVDPDNGDYHIGLGSGAVDRAIDGGVDQDIDGQPRPIPAGGRADLGADEFTGIDLSPSRMAVDGATVDVGEPLTYTIALLNRGWQTATPVILFDAVPEHTAYVSGTAYATAGSLSDGDGIHWTGTLSPQQPVTIGFRVTVTERAIIENRATITDPYGVVSSLAVRVAPWNLYLPITFKHS